MDASHRIFFLKLGGILSVIFLLFTPVLYFNIVIDPNGILHIQDQDFRVVPNERYVKVRHLRSHPDAYDGIVFGSSRAAHMDVTQIPNQRMYNFTSVGSGPKEYLEDLKQLLAAGVPIRHVMLGVDEVSYSFDDAGRAKTFSYAAYPASAWSRAWFIVRYVLHVPDRGYVHDVLHPPFTVRTDINQTGRYFNEPAERDIREHPEAHTTDQKKFPPRIEYQHRVFHVDETLRDIRALAELCRAHDIDLIVFVYPLHQAVWRSLDWPTHESFLRGLVRITPYWDFHGTNTVTTNNLNYFENSHFLPSIGDAMIDTMLHGTSTIPNFGMYITPQTSDPHLNQLRAAFEAAQKN